MGSNLRVPAWCWNGKLKYGMMDRRSEGAFSAGCKGETSEGLELSAAGCQTKIGVISQSDILEFQKTAQGRGDEEGMTAGMTDEA